MTEPHEDRRHTPRVPGTPGQEVVLPLAPTVQILDISMSGALLSSPQAFEIGRRAELRTTLGGEPFVVEIQVRRVAPNAKAADTQGPARFHLGVAFVSLDERNLRCIQQFLRQKPA